MLASCSDASPAAEDASGIDGARPMLDAALFDAGPRPDGASPGVDATMPDVDAGVVPDACPAIVVAHGMSVDGFSSDVYTWRDSRCRPRSAAMVRNDSADPAGHSGGYLRRYTYELADGTARTCDGSSTSHPGFGYTVTHFGSASASSSSRDTRGTYRTVLEGAHHTIHEYHWTGVAIDGQDVAITIRWMFATGRDHPLWAITYDLSGVAADSVNADTRSPYGDLQWDGGGGVEVDGVGWGDRYRFRSLDSPVDLMSGWDYSRPNTIPHVIEWSVAADAEMGLVQTQTYLQHDGGGYWFYSAWGTTNAAGPMPEDWNWTYQLNQYEIPFLLTSKRMAWGANFGAVGQRMYNAYGDDRTLSGYPYQSYAVFVVLDRHAVAPVDTQVHWVEAVQSVAATATTGTVVTSGPAGVGRTDIVTYDPAGWDPIYAVWSIRAAANRAVVSLDTGVATLACPMLHVTDWTATSQAVTLDGRTLAADREYFATIAAGELWITLASDLTGSHAVDISAP